MKFQIITLFPDYFALSLEQSLIGKAREKQLFDIEIVNLREYATDRHRTADDTPYGGGGGMVLKIEPVDRCLQALGYRYRQAGPREVEKERIVLTSAAGRKFDQKLAVELSLIERLTIVCGHYLGVDERLLDLYDIDEISIGDYVLTGGEPAAAVMVDAIARLIPGALGNFGSALEDSFMNRFLGAPCYTRPPEYAGLTVPEVLVSGNHEEIAAARRRAALEKCARRRPDLLEGVDLSEQEKRIVSEVENDDDGRQD
jgi:tRNA (guanine37-N1)-methyltransferase